MPNDTVSGRITEKGPITRAAREALSKKVATSPSITRTRKSEQLSPPTVAVRGKSENHKKMKMTTPSPLRRSERTRNLSSPPPSDPSPSTLKSPVKKHVTAKQLRYASEDEDNDAGTSSNLNVKRMDARTYRAFFKKQNGDCHEESSRTDRSTMEDGSSGGGKIDECFKENSLHLKAVSKDGIMSSEDAKTKDMSAESKLRGPVKELLENNVNLGLSVPSDATTHETSGTPERVHSGSQGEETSQMLASRNSDLNENLSRKCVGHDKGEKLRGPVKEPLENNDALGSSVPSDATTHETSGTPERVQSDSHGQETSQMLASKNSDLNEILIKKCVGHDKGENLRGPVKELIENNVTLGSPVPSNATTHETSVAPERVQSDYNGQETSQMLASKNSDLNENLIKKCAGHDKGEKLTSSNRKRTMVDKYSDISATSVDDDNCNLTMDVGPSRLCGNIVETSASCSKRIRRISISDVQRDQRKLINNVDQPSSKSNDEKSSARNKEGKSGDSVERPQGNNIETEKIRKQQSSLHLSLKPKIAKLCEILLLPDNVKSMVENCLEYTMNNYQICTEPASILQAFQLSLCWIAAALLKHKLDFEASLMLAKQHLNFDCKREVVDEINSRLWDLKDNFLLLTGNSKVIGSPKASKSSNRVYSNPEVTPEIELTKRDISKDIKETQEHQNQWGELLRKQLEEKQKLEKDIGTERADFLRRYRIEWAAMRSSCPNDEMIKEKHKVFNCESVKKFGELKRQHKVRLKDLETKQLEARRKFQESRAPDEFLNLVGSKELGTPHNSPKALMSDRVAEGKSFDNIVKVMTRSGTGVGFSEAPNTNSSEVVLCSSPVELQTPLFKHASVNEIDVIASKDGPVSGNNGETCNGDIPSGEVALAVHKTCSSNDDQVEIISSRQGKLDGTILSKPLCGLSAEVKANDSVDVVKNMASLKSQSPEEHIPSVSTMRVLNCKNAAQFHKADDNNGSNNADTPNSPLSDEYSKSSREHVHSVNVACLPNCEISAQVLENDDGNGSNNVVTLNSPMSDERSADGNVLDREGHGNVLDREGHGNVLDREGHVKMPGTVNFTPSSVEQISGNAVNVSVLDSVLSRPCGTASPSNSPDANAIIPLNRPSVEKQNPCEVSTSIPAGQDPVEASETSHERATVSELDREAAVGMPGTVKSTDYPENATPLNGHEEAECQLTDRVVDKSTTSDHQEGVHRTMTEDTLSHETPVSRPVDLIEPLEQVQPLSSVESPPDQDTVEEMRNSLVSSSVNILRANQTNHASMFVDPPEQVDQLPSAGLLSPNRDPSNLALETGFKNQATNEDTLSGHIAEASNEVQNQTVEQPASNLQVESHSRQVVVPPVINLVPDSLMPSEVRTQSPDTRNLSTPGVVNDHHIQTATQSASRIVPPLCHNPLSYELERIRKLTEQNMKSREDMKLQLKCEFEKEFKELHRKYDIKLKEIEVEFQNSRKNLETQLKTVHVNKILADAFRSKSSNLKLPGLSGTQQDASLVHQLIQLSTQQNASSPSLIGGRPAGILDSSYATTPGSHTMVPPIQATYNPPGLIFGGASARPPHINPISPPLGNLQPGEEIRAPAPHLQPYRPSTSVPASSHCTVPPRGMPSHPAPRPRLILPRPTPTVFQADPHRGHRPENNAGGFPTPNLYAMDLRVDANNQSSINLPNVLPHISSDFSSLNLSNFGTSSMPSNSAHQAATSPDVVCLSDDD